MKNSKVFYRSALATAIVMALSAPAFATDSTVSTDPVTLKMQPTTSPLLTQILLMAGLKQ